MLKTEVNGVRKTPPSDRARDGERAGGVPFLVKGTQNTPNTTLTPVKEHEIYETYTDYVKTYDNKIMHFKFKHLMTRRQQGYEKRQKEPTLDQVLAKIKSNAEQKNHSNLKNDEPVSDDNKDRALRRAKTKVRDYALSNDFDKFATFTFDPSRHNAYDYDYCHKVMCKWLAKQQERHGKFRYIIVSEFTKDGKIHFHALLGGFTGKYHTGNKRKNGTQCYKISSWQRNYGFADMEDIKDRDRIANYITKYLSKDFDTKNKHKKRYWCSKGLKTPQITYQRTLTDVVAKEPVDIANISVYENDWVVITNLPLNQTKQANAP